MDPRICATLPVFHALTGCDTVSAFSGRSKKTAWNTWEVFPEVTEAFEDLLLIQATMALLERFVVLLYDRTSDIINVNEARKVQQSGAGNWVQQGGSHCGQFSLKHHCPAMS